MKLNQVGALKGEDRTIKDKSKASYGTGTSKGNQMVVEEGRDKNRPKVKRRQH